MAGTDHLDNEQAEALEAVEARAAGVGVWSVKMVLVETFSLTFVAEWGDRTQFDCPSGGQPSGGGSAWGDSWPRDLCGDRRCLRQTDRRAHFRTLAHHRGRAIVYRLWPSCSCRSRIGYLDINVKGSTSYSRG